MTTDAHRFLEETGIDDETLEESLRAYVFLNSDFLPPEQMRAALTDAFGEEPVADAVRTLELDPNARSELAQAVLESSLAMPGEAEKIRSAADHTTEKLELVTLTVTAVALLYGFWLLRTGGAKEVRTTTKIESDGTTTVTEVKTNFSFSNPLQEIFRHFGG